MNWTADDYQIEATSFGCVVVGMRRQTPSSEIEIGMFRDESLAGETSRFFKASDTRDIALAVAWVELTTRKWRRENDALADMEINNATKQ
ncbi:hypothetical protein Poly51_17400 [Rubripirellula tenax]|uniref:Uncharacterized protein n=1 Tax=Rubripirellula tenax TaxID=2528015 RepID=A0A5C6FH11_9BACT|nr:hypothetical protein [Rubripirellula tenax]TWU58959.1 hypothetical protein Poly51_17400 [Rubripirellula tenax]